MYSKYLHNIHLSFNKISYLPELLSDKFKTSEENVLSYIGTVLTNAKDWDGNRKIRSQKRLDT